ncbi:MAG: YceI family protein [Rickettsiales bacterium]|nr:YceI family protein [Rickettsiales bacterium]
MKKFVFATATLAALSVSSLSTTHAAPTGYQEMPAGVYQLDNTHASLIWKVSHLGLSNYTARFTDFDANVTFDPENPEMSKVTASINPTSIETDYPNVETKDFNKKLSDGEDWFNSKTFPEITFTSTGIKRTGDNKGIMTGNLSFLGVTKPVSLDVTFNGAFAKQPFSQKPTLGFSASGNLKRSDWGMDTYVPNIGDEVALLIEAEFVKN